MGTDARIVGLKTAEKAINETINLIGQNTDINYHEALKVFVEQQKHELDALKALYLE